MRIAIAAGGTAGHVVPALAVADALQARGARVEFIGGERAEAELVPAAGYPFHRVRVQGIDRTNPVRAAGAVLLAARATGRARGLLREIGADAVLGGGGYVAGPVGLAARTLRLPLALSEADSHLGISNRLLAPLARRVFLAFPLADRSGSRYLVTGRPVRFGTQGGDRDAARARLGVDRDAACVLVFGGSLGARRLNHAALAARGARIAGALPPLRLHRAVRGRAGRRGPGGRAGGRLGLRAGGRGPARDPRALSARHGRSPERERTFHGAGRRGCRDAGRPARRSAPGSRGGRASGRAAADGGDGEGRRGGGAAGRGGAGGG